MKQRKTAILVAIPVLLCLIFLWWYASENDKYKMDSVKKEPWSLSEEEESWIKENPFVPLAVDDKLDYLKTSGFLYSYGNEVLSGSGMTVDLVDAGEVYGKIVVVNHCNREKLAEDLLTKPLFQIEGRLYARDEIEDKEKYTAIVLRGDFTDSEKKRLTYRDRPLVIREVECPREAVEKAQEEGTDLIIGDVNLLNKELHQAGLEDTYRCEGHKVFTNNVCVSIPAKHQLFFDIINEGIIIAPQEAYIGSAKLRAGEEWVISGSEDRYTYSIALLVIIFLAVFGGFFIYYVSTKNMYDELRLRMAQLTESKNEMQTTFNGVSSFMAELDNQGRVLNMNRFMRESLELTAGDVAERNICHVMGMDPKDTAEAKKAIALVAEGKEVEILTAVIDSRAFDIRIYPIKNQKMEVEKLLFMGADVTEVRIAQKQMLQQNKMIAVGQLAASVAHEIRNPLGLIRNYCYVLKNIDDEEKRNQAITMIEKAVERSGEIIAALLNFSRESEGKQEVIPVVSHMNSVVLINEGILKKKNIDLTIESAEDYSVTMRKESFDMIFINLLTNAVDAISDRGKILVKVGRERSSLTLDISDTGKGIPKEIIGDIFNPFFTTKGSIHGNGLGLYIVYNEVEKMNGSISVESEEGKGTAFHLRLPIIEEKTNG